MVMYMNAHTALEQLRQKAEEDGSRGPRVSVIIMHFADFSDFGNRCTFSVIVRVYKFVHVSFNVDWCSCHSKVNINLLDERVSD